MLAWELNSFLLNSTLGAPRASLPSFQNSHRLVSTASILIQQWIAFQDLSVLLKVIVQSAYFLNPRLVSKERGSGAHEFLLPVPRPSVKATCPFFYHSV